MECNAAYNESKNTQEYPNNVVTEVKKMQELVRQQTN